MEKTAKVLVVDDEKAICNSVEKILSRNNIEVSHAVSAEEAMEKMAKESFSLLISDIVMPKVNGLELLKMVKEQWPLMKVVMMTAYASTDTAMKAIRLGALDYVAKPFTPDELRTSIEKSLSGELVEAETRAEEKKGINVMAVDMPFDRDEVAEETGEAYADMLGPSDMPVVEVPGEEPLPPHYCMVGEMVCDIYKKLGNTCKAGLKTKGCPQKKAKKKKTAGKKKEGFDSKGLIGIDQPFNYEEVVRVTGPEYVENLYHEGITFMPYEALKKRMGEPTAQGRTQIDEDAPFDRNAVAEETGEAYADMLGPSDMPVVEVPGEEPLPPHYCMVGEMVCDIYKKLGNTCKAGLKTKACPQKKAKKKKTAGKAKGFDGKKMISVDLPFDYEEVVQVTGPDYVENLYYDGVLVTPYEKLKERVSLSFEKGTAQESILVIDDEAAVNNNIRKILAKKGYQVDQAMNREDALRKISERPYALALLDLKIPNVNGLELLKALREKRPDTMVIIITGYASIETAVETARLGAVDYLSKPFTPDEVREATDRALHLAA